MSLKVTCRLLRSRAILGPLFAFSQEPTWGLSAGDDYQTVRRTLCTWYGEAAQDEASSSSNEEVYGELTWDNIVYQGVTFEGLRCNFDNSGNSFTGFTMSTKEYNSNQFKTMEALRDKVAGKLASKCHFKVTYVKNDRKAGPRYIKRYDGRFGRFYCYIAILLDGRVEDYQKYDTYSIEVKFDTTQTEYFDPETHTSFTY